MNQKFFFPESMSESRQWNNEDISYFYIATTLFFYMQSNK